MKYPSLLILALLCLMNTMQSQDTLKLKNQDTMLVDVLQMDRSSVFFIDSKDSIKTIKSMNWENIEFLHLFKNNFAPGEENFVDSKDTIPYFYKKPVGISLDIFPGLGGSLNCDIGKNVNISVGAGLFYSKFGTKLYITKPKKGKRLFIDTNLYNFVITRKNYLNFNFGIEIRKIRKINFVFDCGVFVSNEVVFPMIGLGFGIRI
jgi:hypothetical protein